MRSLPVWAVLALAGCMSTAQTTPYYGDEYGGMSTGPDDPNFDSQSWGGPPGGAMDPGYGYEYPGTDENAMYAGGEYADPNAGVAVSAGAGGGEAGAWVGATADVTDAEIESTLQPYGQWIEDPDYGNVWRPNTTVVGADFTPYESCGTWVWTDYGWTFQSCDAWSWGWLPFHYGRWVFLDNSWCWSRDYTWGPGWVEWRHGRDVVGWRPLRPTRQIRDHRDRDRGRLIRDHRRGDNDRWRFTNTADFGRRPLRDATRINVRDGLAATTSVAQPPMRGETRVRAAAVMGTRNSVRAPRGGMIGQSTRGSSWTQPQHTGPSRSWGTNNGWNRPNQPTWNRNRDWNRGAVGGYQRPPQGQRPQYGRPTTPNNGQWGGYNRPSSRPNSWGGGYGGYSRPNTGGYTRPSAPTARPNYGGGYSRPSSGGYSRPSRGSYGGSGGGAGYSRPSAPSRGSYSSPSRSSGSYSSPSRGSSSSSRGSSSSGSSRGSSSSGGSRSGRSR